MMLSNRAHCQTAALGCKCSPHPWQPLDHQAALKARLVASFPNTILLPESQLPSLVSSRHYVNLTNGLDAVPLLEQAGLPYSFTRIRSTALEQQQYEQLMLELDAGLLLPLALGHSCIVWDAGSRSHTHGAPRALWYGLEFIRFALQRSWWGAGGAAHLKGHDVSRDFEASCRVFHQSTSRRLKYYQRFVPPSVVQRGVSLYGLYRRTPHDEDVQHWVSIAQQYCSPPPAAADTPPGGGGHEQEQGWKSGSSSSSSKATVGSQIDRGSSPLTVRDLELYELLAEEGYGLFQGGMSHGQCKAWR